MKTKKNTITDADLLAYVDGLLDTPRLAEIRSYLAEHPLEAEKVERWRIQNETLHQLYDHVAGETVPARFDAYRIAADIRRTAAGWRQLAAAAVICLAIGGAAGMYGGLLLSSRLPATPPLVAEAVDAHNLYTSEVVHPVEVRASQHDHLASWLSKRLDRSIDIPDLRKAGFDLVGGRLLPAGGKPAAQFMYEDKGGRRITLYIVPRAHGEETSFRYTEIAHLRAFYWLGETISCALVGDLPRQELQDLARQAYQQLT